MNESKLSLLRSELGEVRVKTGVSLADYVDSRVDGIIEAAYVATNSEELCKALDLCIEIQVPYLLVGTGSKFTLKIGKTDSLLIKNRADSIKIIGIKGMLKDNNIGVRELTLNIESGLTLQGLARYLSKQGINQLDGLKSAPGSIGGSILNSRDLRELVSRVRVWTKSGIKDRMLSEVKGDDIILSVIIKVKRT